MILMEEAPLAQWAADEHPLVGDKCAATEPLLVNEESSHPGERVRNRFVASHNSGSSLHCWNSTLASHTLRPFLVARVGKRGWRSKSLWRKKSRRKLCARAPWSDRWVLR